MRPLSLELVEFLLTPAAQAALADLAAEDLSPQAELALLGRLRRAWSPAETAALLDQARLRGRAAAKFPHPERLLFTDDALQQASARAVAMYHAARFVAAFGHAPAARVADLGCGIGADTIALAEAGLHVLAVEQDPVRAAITTANVAALGLAARVEVIVADWRVLDLPVQAAFVDPSRRAGEQRIFRLSAMQPPIEEVLALRERIPALALKTMPGIADEDIPAGTEVEFISLHGEMKEALLCWGQLRAAGGARRATILPGPHHLDSRAPCAVVPVGPPRAWLYEPDAALLRATLVQHLATQFDAAQLDPTIAYLTADAALETPWARRWRVLRHAPFHLKTLNHWLRDIPAREVVVKKRGSAVDPDEFRRRLKLTPGSATLTLFLTRVNGKPWMIVAE